MPKYGFDNRPSDKRIQLADNVASNISGIFSTRSSARYLSGARCILRVNGKISAFAFGVSWRINTSAIEINTIDDYMPYELAPQRITVEGTIQGLRIPGISAGTELWQADVLSFMKHRYIAIEVRDVATNNLIFYTKKAMITSRAEDIKVDDLASVQLSFKAIGFKDERNPEATGDTLTSKVSQWIKQFI
jgi:hypothetical protein